MNGADETRDVTGQIKETMVKSAFKVSEFVGHGKVLSSRSDII